MARSIDFSPTIIIKEKDGSVNTAVVVDNGPALMEDTNDGRGYTDYFHELIEHFPTILTATFYGKGYTSYRIKLEGEDPRSAISIKKYLLEEE